mmetsp:Transcript_35530/g.36200  ORF Transcript_35530/g.36200 Transcript_35530/m.36200 type:complete len:221 (-) Transcript_35530:16-678(-)
MRSITSFVYSLVIVLYLSEMSHAASLTKWISPTVQKACSTLSVAVGICISNTQVIEAAEFGELMPYTSPDNHFSIKHPSDLHESPKLVKTHEKEVFFKSGSIKGFNAGVSVDRVKVSSLKEFASPESLANIVVSVEKAKEGVFDVNILHATETTPICDDLPSYEIEYIVESSRGKNHFLVKTTIVDKNLYVLTVQGPDDKYVSDLSDTAIQIVSSLKITR